MNEHNYKTLEEHRCALVSKRNGNAIKGLLATTALCIAYPMIKNPAEFASNWKDISKAISFAGVSMSLSGIVGVAAAGVAAIGQEIFGAFGISSSKKTSAAVRWAIGGTAAVTTFGFVAPKVQKAIELSPHNQYSENRLFIAPTRSELASNHAAYPLVAGPLPQ